MDDYEIINLTPDMSQVWGNLLKKLREQKQSALYAVCAAADAEFTADAIYVTLDDSSKIILQKNQQLLNDMVGADVIRLVEQKNTKNPKTEILKKLFGETLTVI